VSDVTDHRPTEPKRADQSLGELFKEMSSELGDLFRQEVQLAKLEATDEVRSRGRRLRRWPSAASRRCCS
jgi:hypothetical protein